MPDGAAPSISPAPAGQTQTPDTKRGLLALLARRRQRSDNHDTMMQHATTGNGGTLSLPERDMIDRIIAFDKKRVDDVAIPRADIIGVDFDVALNDLLKCFSEANHSRLPVYRGDLDDPVGMVHIKDVVGVLADPEAQAAREGRPVLEGLIRQILYVPPSMPVTDLLLRMQVSRVHMALVIDEYGGTDGLVTIEDLIELIVGDIRDEHDMGDSYDLKQMGDQRWDADARTPLEDLAGEIGIDLRLEDHDAETLGGLVASLAGRVPLRGEVISHPDGHDFEVRDADPRRIRRILIRLASIGDAAPAEPVPADPRDE
ncbi:hemolysin family protein [Parvularcula sp. LCG005]|uniref:hemolysin family protein n=1 Tax=Parvularcula sp. LCG005 TaxID=3078805 RepID=UPI002942CD3A|nr:hemolysin family protein [Parvularcula sp. LCG005]WOI53348.1 hemolysin family protein [Parvularcula sp. LCG005]